MHSWELHKPLYLKKSDDRYKKHKKQLRDRGFSDAETWSLDYCVAAFTLPRLKRFREITVGTPSCFDSPEKWHEVLDKMIVAFELIVKEFDGEDEVDSDKINEGLDLFREYFRALWF